MTKRELIYPSSDKKHGVHALIWLPDEPQDIKGIVQIAHGMNEYAERYEEFARFLTENNFICCANDHLGHGETADGVYGYMGESKGYLYMIDDMNNLREMMLEGLEGKPYFILGHSMGSFLARCYATRYGSNLTGLLLSGTGQIPAFSEAYMAMLALSLRFNMGKRTAEPVAWMMSRLMNKRFTDGNSGFEWLSRDKEVVNKALQDEYMRRTFTYAGYLDMFTAMKEVSDRRWAYSMPKNLPVYIFSGTEDPVGDYTKGVRKVYNRLRAAKCEDISMRLYKGGRHEMLNETNRKEVYGDILIWLKKHLRNNDARV